MNPVNQRLHEMARAIMWMIPSKCNPRIGGDLAIDYFEGSLVYPCDSIFITVDTLDGILLPFKRGVSTKPIVQLQYYVNGTTVVIAKRVWSVVSADDGYGDYDPDWLIYLIKHPILRSHFGLKDTKMRWNEQGE